MFRLSQSDSLGEVLRSISSRGVPVLVGANLLVAAALKAHQLATGPFTEDNLFTSRWFLIALVEIELALGLWLLTGAFAKQARLAALATFTSFGLMSLYRGLTGASSCGCFGMLHISPWHTLWFDLLAVAMLWRWPPETHLNICWGGGGAPLVRTLSVS